MSHLFIFLIFILVYNLKYLFDHIILLLQKIIQIIIVIILYFFCT